MLKSIFIGCHSPTAFAQLPIDQHTQVAVVSALTMANLVILGIGCLRGSGVKTSKSTPVASPLEVWRAGNVSIALWMLCLVAMRMGSQ